MIVLIRSIMLYLRMLLIAVLLYACNANTDITIGFAGDVMLDRGVRKQIETQKESGFLFDSVRNILSLNQYNVVNLESPFTLHNEPARKEYVFRCEPEWLTALFQAYITHTGIANNHILDHSQTGADDTFKNIESHQILSLGYDTVAENASKPAIIEQNGVRVAVFAANMLTHDTTQYSKRLYKPTPTELSANIKSYKQSNPSDVVVLFLHWGVENTRYPLGQQVENAHQWIDDGADMIIGHHSHVVQYMEFYKNKPIVYSLGNFVFDAAQPDQRKGLLCDLTVGVEGIKAVQFVPVNIKNACPVPMSEVDAEEFMLGIETISQQVVFEQQGLYWAMEQKKNEYAQTTTIAVKDDFFDGTFAAEPLQKMNSYRFTLTSATNKTPNFMRFDYNLYYIDKGDINNDGHTDILVGAIKATHFDSLVKRRLFLYSTDKGQLHPLWLGSRVCQELITFAPLQDTIFLIKTIEREQNALYCIGIYRWQGFGLELVNYKNSNLGIQEAQKIFNDL